MTVSLQQVNIYYPFKYGKKKIKNCKNTNVNKRRCEFKYFEKGKHFKHIVFVFLISAFDGRLLSFPASYYKL